MGLIGRTSCGRWRIFVLGLAALLGGAILGSLSIIGQSRAVSPSLSTIQTNTWSIVAADPLTGDVGLALASCVPDFHADVAAALVPGKGVAATQARLDLDNRNKVFDMILAGEAAGAIVGQISDSGYDVIANTRQYGVITLHDGQPEIAAFTGSTNSPFAGDLQDLDSSVTVQGNFLESEKVLAEALRAFTSDDHAGHNSLADRLMRALEAGSAAGGDARCNDTQITQTAATAFIIVARAGDDPFAVESMGATAAGTPGVPWLALSVSESRFGPNAVLELRRQYDAWRLENPRLEDENSSDETILLLVISAVLVLFVIGITLYWLRRPVAIS